MTSGGLPLEIANVSESVRELHHLIDRGPDQLTEFMPDPEVTSLVETLVALANADGGTILVGLSESGGIAETATEDLEALLTRAQEQCLPPILVQWETIGTSAGTIVALSVPRSPYMHKLSDGTVLLRSGSVNRPLEQTELYQLLISKGTESFEEQPVAGVTQDGFDAQMIKEYQDARRKTSPRLIQKMHLDEMLRDAGALDDLGVPTVAGLLLFGCSPEQHLPQAGLVFVRFSGIEMRGPDGVPRYRRREEINGPLARVIQQAWEVIGEEMRHEAAIPGLAREEQPEYPPSAVREALVNAVCHRDYHLAGRRVEIRMFDDRLEIISPGGLPGHITLDNIVEEHFSRNPRLVRGLYYWGYIEELGLGIDRMIEDMLRAGHPAPHFESRPFTFTVVLSNALERPESQWSHILNERQLTALKYVHDNGRITNRDFRELCPNVTAETIRLDLADMVGKGILLRVGAKRGTYYIVK